MSRLALLCKASIVLRHLNENDQNQVNAGLFAMELNVQINFIVHIVIAVADSLLNRMSIVEALYIEAPHPAVKV